MLRTISYVLYEMFVFSNFYEFGNVDVWCFLDIHVHNLTCVKQWTGHDIMHLRHWLHLILFNVQVLLHLFTVIAFVLQISSHFPHKLHWPILFPMRHRDLCFAFKSSEKSNFPIESPIKDDPPRCLKFKTSLFFNQST